nr:MAG TPA: hypothetical protein [Caudoviricetes sp.]
MVSLSSSKPSKNSRFIYFSSFVFFSWSRPRVN